ncbi:hypothetical protein H4R34_005521 [Dimargaris verticillata]|uniref:F-box domain-containing protein n=1 Tax=Dimargaris verticillata TaxID=2761393 RepID=A0A9W8EB61_9FUNG|nr:hypothetical protein H4R34_005521 [Dimargaris verticillata]
MLDRILHFLLTQAASVLLPLLRAHLPTLRLVNRAVHTVVTPYCFTACRVSQAALETTADARACAAAFKAFGSHVRQLKVAFNKPWSRGQFDTLLQVLSAAVQVESLSVYYPQGAAMDDLSAWLLCCRRSVSTLVLLPSPKYRIPNSTPTTPRPPATASESAASSSSSLSSSSLASQTAPPIQSGWPDPPPDHVLLSLDTLSVDSAQCDAPASVIRALERFAHQAPLKGLLHLHYLQQLAILRTPGLDDDVYTALFAACPKLAKVFFYDSAITDATLVALVNRAHHATTFKQLDLFIVPGITDQGLISIITASPTLRHLTITECANLQGQFLYQMMPDRLPDLRYLSLSNSSRWEPAHHSEALSALFSRPWQQLVRLHLTDIHLDDGAMKRLAIHCPSLRELRLVHCVAPNSGYGHLFCYGAQLRVAEIRPKQYLDISTAFLRGGIVCRRLQRLCIAAGHIDPMDFLCHRFTFAKLEYLYLPVTKAHPRFDALTRAFPALRIHFAL